MVKALSLEELELKTLAKLLELDIVRLNKTANDPVRSQDVRFSATFYAGILATALAKINALSVVAELTAAVPPADEYLDSNGVAT